MRVYLRSLLSIGPNRRCFPVYYTPMAERDNLFDGFAFGHIMASDHN